MGGARDDIKDMVSSISLPEGANLEVAPTLTGRTVGLRDIISCIKHVAIEPPSYDQIHVDHDAKAVKWSAPGGKQVSFLGISADDMASVFQKPLPPSFKKIRRVHVIVPPPLASTRLFDFDVLSMFTALGEFTITEAPPSKSQ